MAETKSETKPSEQHKLNKAWSLWYKGIAGGGKGNADDWDCGTLAYTFDTAENFWSMYNNVTAPSKLPDKCDYSIFAKDIKPKYEDPKNDGGGEFRISIQKGRGSENNGKNLDEWFLNAVLGAIGETLDETCDVINGVVVNIRKREDRVCIWTSTCDPDKINEVGRRLRLLLKLDTKVLIKFQTFAEGKVILTM